jgi:large repetitive protein
VMYNSGGYGTGGGAITDVNGDCKPDIIVANCSTTTGNVCDRPGSLGVLLGNGDGTFQPVVTSEVISTNPVALAVADLNGDGKPDAVVTSPGGVTVLLGKGDGTFDSGVVYSAGGSGANAVTIADVNGDGKPDLLVANCNNVEYYCDGNGSVGVLLGKGNGTFHPAVNYSSGGVYARSLAVGDVNGDGKPDLVVANTDSGTVGVLLGRGNGTFKAVTTYELAGAPSGPLAVTISDVNGDGKPDLVASVLEAGLLLGNGDGTFQPASYYHSGMGVMMMAAADVNGDGKPDLAMIAYNGVGALLNNNGAPASTTSLMSSMNPVNIKQTVTYTASVTPQSAGTLNGSIEFMDGPNFVGLVPLTGNQASMSASYTSPGPHALTALYSGDLNHASASVSSALTENVLGTSVTKETTSGSPSQFGQSVTFTATVTSRFGAIPDGEMVMFTTGNMLLGSVALSGGKAACTTSAIPGGTHVVKAIYAGDSTFASSTGTLTQVVDKYATTTALVSSLNPSVHGQEVTFTATVSSSGPAPTGNVRFRDGTTTLGSVALSGNEASLTRSTLAAGSHSIVAEYVGNGASATSTSTAVNQVVNP